MRNQYKILIIAIAGLILGNCSEDYLETKPIAMETTETFYSTQSGADAAITAVYSQLCTRDVWDKFYMLSMGSVASDDAEAGGANPNDGPDWVQTIDKLTHQPTNADFFEHVWAYMYKGIYYSNLVIEKVPGIKESDSEADPALIDRYVAEAKFLRALNHFALCQVFGEVPLVDHVLLPSEFEQSRSTFKALFDFMEKDLKEAAAVLPTSYSASDIGRATKGAANALLAKILIYQSSYAKNYPGDSRFTGLTERWGDALTAAELVISSDVYKLVGIDGETYNTWWGANTNGYRYVFTVEGDNSPESIFEVQNVQDGLGWTSTRGNYMTIFSTVRSYINAAGSPTALGWGFNCPTQSLLDAHEVGDPRLATSIGQTGDLVLVDDGGLNWFEMDLSISPTGMAPRKYECSPDQYWGPKGDWQDGPLNLRLIRYADLVLFASEAAFESSNSTKALEYINMVRTRARACGGPSNTVPANLTAVTLDDIINERRVELALEGHRFYDLVRWRLAEEKIDGNQLLGGTFTVDYQAPKHDFFPLPDVEVVMSGQKLVQYPGW